MEIVPPTNSRHRGLADVMDAMFKSNHKETEDLRDEDADAEADDEELPPPQVAPADVSPILLTNLFSDPRV
ncbi:hypothetical protein NLJ89_g5309 [Agrocybe chaxingu]|uniref:Uncharacterized protein n=1 Tax=Agrocybe chaxingu TaxID=84603 RepID=A0A9W8K1C9_9AGAR|nr:hypothetical protein NLJ89_g5309 [Agrocybe chaxingu]